MKTATLDVGDMLSMLDYRAVEKQLGKLPGVHRVAASIASNSVTASYDETITSITTLRDKITECGFHCTGQVVPKHVCEPHAAHGHGAHMPAPRAPAQAGAAPPAPMPMPHDMAQEMGHGAGMDMQGMVRDMRNRFWICLVFTVPIFLFSPMGFDAIRVAPPLGLDLNLVLFFLASAAILYPVWPLSLIHI